MDRDTVLLAHGGGGRLTAELITRVFLRGLDPNEVNAPLRRLEDSAVLPLPADLPPGARLSLTTDGYVVRPLFFPGGDIGRIAVCGTVNDLAVSGARPHFLTSSFVIEEGLPIETLVRVAESMRLAAEEAGVSIVAGDTKVVERGSADKLFITTAGVGIVPPERQLSSAGLRRGDAIILSGTIGDHGIAIATRRAGLEMEADVQSDAAPLNHLVEALFASGAAVRTMRDATRGGVAAVLNELAQASNVGMMIDEKSVPVHDAVRAACDILGFDPLYVANEGKLVAFVAREDAPRALRAMRESRYGQESAIIGEVVDEPKGSVLLRTEVGGTRIVAMPSGELLPRIC